MWIYVWDTEIKWIYLWDTPVKEVYLWDTKIRPTYRTFTISWTEQSNMSSWWTYSDDAAWLTAWSWDFDDFFWYSAVLLNTSWVETAEMTQSWWVFTGAMTTLGNITSGDNVMIKFPIRWIKMTKSWSLVTLSITEELNKAWYQYYAFSRNWTIKDRLYLWAYKASKVTQWWTQYLRSYSWQSAASSVAWDGISYLSLSNACTLAQKNSWYDEITWYQRQYVNALYMMKYWNPNSQSLIWFGYCPWWSSTPQTTWATNSITNATWWTNIYSNWRIKLFWLEDRWGNVQEWLNWVYVAYNWWAVLQTSSTQAFTTWKISTFDKETSTVTAANNYIQSVTWTNDWMFTPTAVQSWQADYYADLFSIWTWSYLLAGWWYYQQKSAYDAWAFCINYFSDSAPSIAWARLMYL